VGTAAVPSRQRPVWSAPFLARFWREKWGPCQGFIPEQIPALFPSRRKSAAHASYNRRMFSSRWKRVFAPERQHSSCRDSRPRLSSQVKPCRAALLAACLTSCIFLRTPALWASDCIPIHEAHQHVGETQCVAGKVLRVKVGAKGVHFLDFCEDQMACPFTVVVFSHDLKDVGDVRRLAGRTIEVHGAVKLYDGRAEIILNRISQITGGAALIPPLPKNYDVENRGHYSAGRLRPTKKPAKTKPAPNPNAAYGNDVESEDPPE
jgi:hypothetical protein